MCRRVAGAFMTRLRARAASESRLKILDRFRVTPRQGLLLVEVEDERLLVATSDGSATAFYPLRRPVAIPVEGSCV
nr:flagellar biosynthetic protein FliO [Occallatibacter savannae]